MKVKKLQFLITTIVTLQVSYIRAVNVNHVNRHFRSTKRSSYLNNDSNLFLSDIVNTKVNSETIFRQIRHVDHDIDTLNIRIANFTESLKELDRSKIESNSNLNFSRPTSSGKFEQLEIEIKKIKEEIKKMKNAIHNAGSSQMRFGALEKSLETLQKFFDDKNREFSTQVESLESFVGVLKNAVIEIKEEVDRINLQLLPDEIIRDVKGRDFDNAVRKIRKLDNLKKQVNYVVHEVFDNNENNIDLILQFGDSSKKYLLLNLQICVALFYEISSNNHINNKKMLLDKVIGVSSIKNLSEADLEGLSDEVKKEIEEFKQFIMLIWFENFKIVLSDEANEQIGALIMDIATFGTLGLTEKFKHDRKNNTIL